VETKTVTPTASNIAQEQAEWLVSLVEEHAEELREVEWRIAPSGALRSAEGACPLCELFWRLKGRQGLRYWCAAWWSYQDFFGVPAAPEGLELVTTAADLAWPTNRLRQRMLAALLPKGAA
jgi:hypothetical protein